MKLTVRRIVGLALIALLVALTPALAKEKSAKRGLLWKVKSETGTVWLFGSIHLASEAMVSSSTFPAGLEIR